VSAFPWRPLSRLAISIVIFCLTAELLGLAAFYWDTGHLFYTWRNVYETIPETAAGQLTGDGLHPYFGPTHKPGHPFDIPEALRATPAPPRVATNNFGFVSPHDYPYTPRDGEALIGLFGGSVGVWFCQIGAPRLVEQLRELTAFRGRTLVPLCFSHEGYKQPQQLQVLSYFLSLGQRFDLVINIDGFNEVALSPLNHDRGIESSMPSSQHLEPLINLASPSTMTPDKVQSLAAIARDKERVNALVDRLDRNRIAAVHLVLERLYRRTLARYRAETVRFSTLPSATLEASLIQATRPAVSRSLAEERTAIAANWARASLLMHQMLAARSVLYVHVLQPNQYYGARRFGDDEARVAINDQSPFKVNAAAGYPLLLSGEPMRILREGGVRFVDGTRLFDAEPAAVYIDDCCHYTRRGNEILADFVARRISDSGVTAVTAGTGSAR
jgi:hypothetical protein